MPLALIPWPSSVTPVDGPPLRPQPGTRREIAQRLAASAERLILEGHGPEGYQLIVSAAGVRIESSTAAGAFYAEQTLAQLVQVDADGPLLPAVEIRDVPRFGYRGVMLDVARHFHPVSTVEAVIDRAAALKLNALHLHLTDDQGWRLELASHPELAHSASGTSVGGDPGGFYTRAEYAGIVEYAAARHMIVVPEFDLPGHTHAVGLSHPELLADPVISEHVAEITEQYGGGGLPEQGVPYTAIAVGFSSLRADAPGLEPFLREVLGEIAAVTPGPYVHVGGDEALGTDPADFRAMIELATRIVAETGKTPLTWHEASVADLPRGTIGQYWGFRTGDHAERARAFADKGGRLILSPADAIYLDMKYDAETPIGLTWADGPTSVARSYDWDPAGVIPDLPEPAILGVEAPLWTETVRTLADIDLLMFPRIGSAAEAGWSPPAGSAERTWESFRERIAGLAEAWTEAGIGFHRADDIPWR
ncbi:family 20 glycosylhydrolase [Microbacterium paludicola]|uniref:family 20 glycosylhydrolase n=1 Tax=Microbacterium paludicola TaxID=300019 RepID=UPI0038796935